MCEVCGPSCEEALQAARFVQPAPRRPPLTDINAGRSPRTDSGQVAERNRPPSKRKVLIMRSSTLRTVAAAVATFSMAAKLPATLMVDCSHANSSKQHERQQDVARDIAGQVAAGSRSVFGLMIESHLVAGAQKFTPGKDQPTALTYGQSITDACLGWDASLATLEELSAAVATRRKGAV